MPVDGPSYLAGRTDERVNYVLSSTNYRCMWTGPYDSTTYKPIGAAPRGHFFVGGEGSFGQKRL